LGDDIFKQPHGLNIGSDDMIYCTDTGDHTVEARLTIKCSSRQAPIELAPSALLQRHVDHYLAARTALSLYRARPLLFQRIGSDRPKASPAGLN